jgi:lysophospholipase L1-like esterase
VATRIAPGDTVVFAGDSITDAGKCFGLGQSSLGTLGDGYVRQVVEALHMRHPGIELTVHNTGVSGSTSRDLEDAWDDWALAYSPDLVTLLLGVNDCYHVVGDDPRGVPADEYAERLDRVIERTLAGGARMVLLQPFYIAQADTADDEERAMLKALGDYHAALDELATRHGLPLVRLHDLFQAQLVHRPASDFCPEPIHPSPTGHAVIAHALLQELQP